VGHEHQRRALGDDLAHALQALLLEAGVTHGQHLVDQQDVGLEEGGDGKPESHLHAARVELDLAVHRALDLREVDDAVEALGDLLTGKAQQGAVQVDVLATGQVRVDARPHLDEGADTPGDLQPAGVRVHHPGQDLEQGGLARAVGADQPHRLARPHHQVDVLERPAPPLGGMLPAQQVAQPLQLVAQQHARPVGAEPLPEVACLDAAVRRHPRTPFPGA
jgi:hypothetical protein